jgi:lysophospholipase L1-like esterase
VTGLALVALVAGIVAMGGCGDDGGGASPDSAGLDGAPADGQADGQAGISIDDLPLPPATELLPYGPVYFTAQNGVAPYTWSLESGSLPLGLMLYDGGQLSGDVPSGTAPASPYTFTVRVDDQAGGWAVQQFTLVVNAGAYPIDDLDEVTLHLNLGDSMGAGYNAESGRGYAPLLHHNHAAYTAYAQHNLQALYPGCQFVSRASSGDTSSDVVGQSNNLPGSTGDTVVTIYVGGNDFNDDAQTMLLSSATQVAIDNWVSNMTTVMTRLRNAYDDSAAGRRLVVLMATIHEPTDGTGTIPSQYTDGFCSQLQQVPPALVQAVMDNYNLFNAAIRDFAAAQDAIIIDTQALFNGHGLTMPVQDQWLDTDCAHATNEGHHQVRREIWFLLTGQRYGSP